MATKKARVQIISITVRGSGGYPNRIKIGQKVVADGDTHEVTRITETGDEDMTHWFQLWSDDRILRAYNERYINWVEFGEVELDETKAN
jgi:hypothetical protein